MTKILISDLFGTAIPDNIETCDYLYGKGMKRKNIVEISKNKEYNNYLLDKIAQQFMFTLKNFLDDGNQLIIVSDLTGHDTTVDFILDEILNRFYKYNNFRVYLVTKEGNSTFDIRKFSDKITKYYTENGISYMIYNGHKIGLIERKIQIFDILKKYYNLENADIYAVGNSSSDVPMLVKCIEKGGKSSILHNVFYTNKILTTQNAHDIIVEYVSHEYQLLKETELLQTYPDYSNFDKATRRKIRSQFNEFADDTAIQNRNEWCSKRISELHKFLRDGQIDIDYMQKQNLTFSMIVIATHHYLEKKTMIENQWDKISLFPTFRDYYNRVLNKSPEQNIEEKNSGAKVLKL